MELAEYALMYECEESHWWYWGLRDLVLRVSTEVLSGHPEARVLDAGCGTGKILETLRRMGYRAIGMDYSAEAVRFAKRRSVDEIARASIVSIPFGDASFDLVISNDVLCCVEPTDLNAAFRELARVLKPSGALLVNLPAYPWLRSRHDEAVHIRQRFTRGRLVKTLSEAGLHVEFLTYRNTLLFPLAATVRLIRRMIPEPQSKAPASDVYALPPPLNAILKLPLALENRWINAGGRLPYGLSLFGLARRVG